MQFVLHYFHVILFSFLSFFPAYNCTEAPLLEVILRIPLLFVVGNVIFNWI